MNKNSLSSCYLTHLSTDFVDSSSLTAPLAFFKLFPGGKGYKPSESGHASVCLLVAIGGLLTSDR